MTHCDTVCAPCLHLLLSPLQEFIEEILSPPFGGMIAFVKEAEALLEKGQLERLKNEEGELKVGGWDGLDSGGGI